MIEVYDYSHRYTFVLLQNGWIMKVDYLENGEWKLEKIYNSSALQTNPFKQNSRSVLKIVA